MKINFIFKYIKIEKSYFTIYDNIPVLLYFWLNKRSFGYLQRLKNKTNRTNLKLFNGSVNSQKSNTKYQGITMFLVKIQTVLFIFGHG